MNRKWIAALFAAMIILLIAGCAPHADDPEAPAETPSSLTSAQTAEPSPTVTDAPQPAAKPSLGPLAGLAGLEATDVRQIDLYDDAHPTDTPAQNYSSYDDISALLGWLQSVRTTKALVAPTTEAPGDWKTYDVALFDGRRVTVAFSGDTVSTGGQQFEYTASATPDIKRQLQLVVDGDSFPADTETVNYSVVNNTDEEAVLLVAPTLGKATESGWNKLDCTAGFCSVADPMSEKVVEHELPIKEWYPDAGSGVFRLSLLAYDENNDPYMISDIFEIK